MHKQRQYWAVMSHSSLKKDGKELSIHVGQKLNNYRFYSIEPLKEDAEPSEIFWYRRVFATKVLPYDEGPLAG